MCSDGQTTACDRPAAVVRALPGPGANKGNKLRLVGRDAALRMRGLALVAEDACCARRTTVDHIAGAVHTPDDVASVAQFDAARDASPEMKSGPGLPTIVTPFGQFAGGAS